MCTSVQITSSLIADRVFTDVRTKWKSRQRPGGIPINVPRALRPTRGLSSAQSCGDAASDPPAPAHELLWDQARRLWRSSWERAPVSAAAATSGTAGTCGHSCCGARSTRVLQASLCALVYLVWIEEGKKKKKKRRKKNNLCYDISWDVYWAAYLQSIECRPKVKTVTCR